MKKFMKNEGFTLVELIVVIAILGILAAVAVPAYTGYIEKANATSDTQTCAAVLTAAQATVAKDGALDAVYVNLHGDEATDDEVAVIVDGDAVKYYLVGTASGSDKAASDAWKADYALFMSGNTLPKEFKQKDMTGAAWTADTNAWAFSK